MCIIEASKRKDSIMDQTAINKALASIENNVSMFRGLAATDHNLDFIARAEAAKAEILNAFANDLPRAKLSFNARQWLPFSMPAWGNANT